MVCRAACGHEFAPAGNLCLPGTSAGGITKSMNGFRIGIRCILALLVLSLFEQGIPAAPVTNLKRAPLAEFEAIAIDTNGPANCWGKAVGDVNGDGKVDLLVGGINHQGLYWYENPSWAKHAIDSKASISTDIELVDLNKDSKGDVVTITHNPGRLIWYEQTKDGWKECVIAQDTLHDIEVADLDGDGKVDMVGRNQGTPGGDTLFFFKQNAIDSWTRTTMPIPGGEGLMVADINGDGKPDAILNSVWYENTGNMTSWTKHVYSSSWSWPNTYIAVGDINGDRRLDIVLSPSEPAGKSYRISWFEAPEDRSKEWKEHVMQENVETVHHFVGVADFNKDGWVDIAAAMMQQGKKPDIRVFLNEGKGEAWLMERVAALSSHSMKIVDVDGQGYPSLFGANWNDKPTTVWLWKNVVADRLSHQ